MKILKYEAFRPDRRVLVDAAGAGADRNIACKLLKYIKFS